MVKFCPKCEKILRKTTETTGIYWACMGCGYRDLIEARERSSLSNSYTTSSKRIDENPHRMKAVQHKSPSPPIKKAMPDQLDKMGQEILLMELKKKKLDAILENLEEGRKKEDITIETIF